MAVVVVLVAVELEREEEEARGISKYEVMSGGCRATMSRSGPFLLTRCR